MSLFFKNSKHNMDVYVCVYKFVTHMPKIIKND